jgi:hypothetical protein
VLNGAHCAGPIGITTIVRPLVTASATTAKALRTLMMRFVCVRVKDALAQLGSG